MAFKAFNTNQAPVLVPQLFPRIGPALIIAVGYIDLGKWMAAFEGGTCFGPDFVLPLVFGSCTAIFCQYLATCVGLFTKKNLAQICSEEYCWLTCIFLGVQAELSMIISDLSLVLGIAHGVNLLFSMNLSICIFFSAIGTSLFPFIITLLDDCKTELLCIGISGFALCIFVLQVLLNQSEVPFRMNGISLRLNGGSACMLMALFGANIMPHNFYIQSSIVQQRKSSNNAMGALSHDHFLAVLLIFSAIFLANYALMSSATVFFDGYSHALTFHDVFLLLDQIFSSPISVIVVFMALFFSSQINYFTQNLGGLVIWHDLFGIDWPFLVRHVVVKLLVLIPALYCEWSGGAEKIYQLLIFSQVILAMLLPSSMIPLFRVASSKSIMGAFKISWHLEILALSVFLGLFGSNVLFIIEMLSGNSSWLINPRDNMGISVTPQFIILLFVACMSLGVTLYLVVTPLKSASDKPEKQIFAWHSQKNMPDVSENIVENDLSKVTYDGDQESKMEPATEKSLEGHPDDSISEFNLGLSELSIGSDYSANKSIHCLKHTSTSSSLASHPEDSKSIAKAGSLETKADFPHDSTSGAKQAIPKDVHGKDGEYGDASETNESEDYKQDLSSPCPEVPKCSSSMQMKGNNLGNGLGTPSKLSGLGRGARRQVAEILNEFWGQLFDTYGDLTEEANSKLFDVLLGLDLMASCSLTKASSIRGCCSSDEQRIPKPNLVCDSPVGSPSRSSNLQRSNACALSFGRNDFRLIETPYRSLCQSLSYKCQDNQPATIHGYQIPSHPRNANRKSSYSDPNAKSVAFLVQNYSYPPSVNQGPNEFGSPYISNLQNPAVSRISRLQGDRPCYGPIFVGATENNVSSTYTKRYHSSPDVYDLAACSPYFYSNDRVGQHGGPVGPRSSSGRMECMQSPYLNPPPLAFSMLSSSNFNSSLTLNTDDSLWYRQPYEQFFCMKGKAHKGVDVGSSSRESTSPKGIQSHLESEAKPYERLLGMAGKPQKSIGGASNGLSISKRVDSLKYSEATPIEQLLSRVGNSRNEEVGVSNRPSMATLEKPSHSESEAKLLQPLRFCITKLLKLEGSDWLFSQNGGSDEDLIDRVAAREKFLYEADANGKMWDPGQKSGSAENSDLTNYLSLMSSCGDGCIWQASLIVSFGVWCITRILQLLAEEKRPDMWGKYTYVLNRLQGIINPAFLTHRSVTSPCCCLEISAGLHDRRPAMESSSSCTKASTVVEMIKRVEATISGRKGRSGAKAVDNAFRMGKENSLSVLKRLRRRLSLNRSPPLTSPRLHATQQRLCS